MGGSRRVIVGGSRYMMFEANPEIDLDGETVDDVMRAWIVSSTNNDPCCESQWASSAMYKATKACTRGRYILGKRC